MPTTDEHLEQIARTAETTPRSAGGLRVNVTISLDAKGHSGLDAKGVPGLPMNNDNKLLGHLTTLIEKLRGRI